MPIKLLWLFIFIFSNAIAFPLKAQIIPDDTTDTITSPTNSGTIIESGDRAGNNLFHSFTEFSLPAGREVLFNNPNDIINIFSRVTGGNISNIDGLLKANGNANLFLINPAGIVFGENASLDIGGSFVASTAESIVFGDNIEFSATSTNNAPLLTVNQPLGLNFGNNIGDIAVNGSNLEVNNGSTLALLGGDITITGGQIIAPGANIQLGGLKATGQISFEGLSTINFPQEIAKGDLTLTNGAEVNVQASGGGNINVNARNLSLSGGELGESNFFAGIAPASGSIDSQGGNINVDVTDTILLNQGSRIRNEVGEFSSDETAQGNAGQINITTDNLVLKEGGRISANNYGLGNTGAITINALSTISADGENFIGLSSGIVSRVFGIGNTEKITIKTNNLTLTNGGRVSATNFGRGSAGLIEIEAINTILADGELESGQSSGIFSVLTEEGDNNNSGINLVAKDLVLTRGGRVDVSTLGEGNAGTITVNVADTISAMGENRQGIASGIVGRVESNAIGQSGGIEIDTTRLSLKQGGVIGTSTFGEGNAGEITIRASEGIDIDGFGTISSIEEITNSSGIFSAVGNAATGNAAGIDINTNDLILTNKGEISVQSLGQGNAGNLDIEANSLSLTEAFLFASAPVGDGGNINLQIANDLTLQDNSTISAEALEDASGGNINIDADFIIAFSDQNNDIIAAADRGVGGNINITTNSLFGIAEGNSTPANNTNDIDASSQFGLDGTVAINELDINPAEALSELPTEIIDVTRLVAQNLCQQEQGSEFIVAGKGGVTSNPLQTRDGAIDEVDLIQPANDPENNSIVGRSNSQTVQTKTKPEIAEAQGWIINDRGNLELVAQKIDTNNYPQPKSDAARCGGFLRCSDCIKKRSRLPESLSIYHLSLNIYHLSSSKIIWQILK